MLSFALYSLVDFMLDSIGIEDRRRNVVDPCVSDDGIGMERRLCGSLCVYVFFSFCVFIDGDELNIDTESEYRLPRVLAPNNVDGIDEERDIKDSDMDLPSTTLFIQ